MNANRGNEKKISFAKYSHTKLESRQSIIVIESLFNEFLSPVLHRGSREPFEAMRNKDSAEDVCSVVARVAENSLIYFM